MLQGILHGCGAAMVAGVGRPSYARRSAAGGTFGFSMSRTDYNKDATPDLYIGQAPHGGGDENGGTYVFGRDGSVTVQVAAPVQWR